MKAIRLPEVSLRSSPKPGFMQLLWACNECGHAHVWTWPDFDIRYGSPIGMRCDHCDYLQRMIIPNSLRAEIQLARHVAERDTDTDEALIDPGPDLGAEAKTETGAPQIFSQWPDALEQRPVRPVFSREPQDDFMTASAHRQVIQDGKLLGRELHTLSLLIERQDWDFIEQHYAHYATILGWSGNALVEFGR